MHQVPPVRQPVRSPAPLPTWQALCTRPRQCGAARWLLPRVGALILLGVSAHALAQAPASVFLEDLTWTEVRDDVRAGKNTIIIPIGGTEQSGPQIALGKHNTRVKILSQRIAESLGNTLVAPVLAYVPEGSYAPASSHMRFPGTLTVSREAFEATLESAAFSLRQHGFTTIVFLGDHGGYLAEVRQVVAHLNQAWAGSPARAFLPAEYYEASSVGYAAMLRQQGFRENEIGTHAGLADTALQLAVAPQMVRQDRLHGSTAPTAADGVYGGDPRRATAALGQPGVEAIVSRTVASIKKFIAARR